MNVSQKALWAIIAVLLLVIAIQMPKPQALAQWASGRSYEIYMTNADTLSTPDQAYIDSLAYKAANIVFHVLNEYGSQAPATVQKNRGSLVIDDGPGAVAGAVGQFVRMEGEGSYGIMLQTRGQHSSAIKLGMDGVTDANHRGINLVMPTLGTQTSQRGILIRNPLGEGVPLEISDGGVGPSLMIVSRDSSVTPISRTVVSVQADSLNKAASDKIVMGIAIKGTGFKGTADRYIQMYCPDGTNYWGWHINSSTNAISLYYNTTLKESWTVP